MKINTLTLRNFRNIDATTIRFNDGLNLIVGNNGQGKTNLVESVVFLSSGRSFRVQDDSVLIQNNEFFTKIHAQILKNDNENILEIVISNDGKYLKINNKVLKKLSEFIGLFNVVLFEPNDLNFFSQTPRLRRKDVDYELGKISEGYLKQLSLVMRLLNERNSYLKHSKIDDDFLDILTQKLVSASIPILKIRHEFVLRLQKRMIPLYKKLTESNDSISLEYRSCVSMSEPSLEAALLAKMNESRKRDLDLKMTHVGIHREDFIFKINKVPVVNIASQGQRRLLMIVFKLAIVELIYERNKEFPVLCLDDLFSELDEKRRQLVLEAIHEDVQVFITTTDMSFVETERNLKILRVSSGNIVEEVV